MFLAACTAPAPSAGVGAPSNQSGAVPEVNAAPSATPTAAAPSSTPTPQPTSTPTTVPTSTPTPRPNPLSIEPMRQQPYPGSDLVIEQTLAAGSNYSRYI